MNPAAHVNARLNHARRDVVGPEADLGDTGSQERTCAALLIEACCVPAMFGAIEA